MKMYCATTTEIDNAEAAVAQILEQLNLEENCLKNSIGFIALYGEFYDTGVYSAVVNALPFPCVGYTTTFLGSNGQANDILLSVVLMTSDVNEFEVFQLDYADTLTDMEGTKRAVDELAEKVMAKGKPSLVMNYYCMSPVVSNEDMLMLFDKALDHTPIFGSVIFSSDLGQRMAFTCIGDGEKLIKEKVLIAVYGELNPHFTVFSGINDLNKLAQPAKVTKAVSSTLYEVNNVPLLEYLTKIGVLDPTLGAETMWVFPALVENSENGTSKVRAFIGISPDCPTAFFATGNIEEGRKISFGHLDAETTNESAKKAFSTLVSEGANCFLGISCVARAWANGANYLKEFTDIGRIFNDTKNAEGKTLNYQVINSGGEFCPIPDKDGNLVNTLHNYSLAICYFKD
ncbi:MAG: hypothetical protein LBM59_02725 [Ruminococcus sp.]|jgi:hypothetical protein|nr:hypothetical protein [Ruminococcus sp.]